LSTFGNTSESAAAYNFVEKFGNKMKEAVNYKGYEGTERRFLTPNLNQSNNISGPTPTIEV
jgi:hypothetical protein